LAIAPDLRTGFTTAEDGGALGATAAVVTPGFIDGLRGVSCCCR
jgi:hypothetical protein